MADFLLMVLEDEAAHAARSARDIAELVARRASFADELRRAGVLRDRGCLRPSKEGKRARRVGDRVRVDDGPFAPALAAYFWIDVADVDEAARFAAACPALASDVVDVRPLMKGRAVPDKEDRPGKIFAFAVLGSAANEAAWTAVMDRIDAETRDGFPAEASVGGVRLQPPTSGRVVATRGDKRATFDGPFVETKEIIGGVFFLRAMHAEDAVRWAADSPFVAHGTLEIREVWRS
jgi:hypothetical protein